MSQIEEERPARRNRMLRQWLQRVGPAVLGLAGIAGLLVVLKPAEVGRALAGFQLALIPVIVLLYVAIYGLQGVRWHYLLRDAGVRFGVWESVLLNAAGQTITALVPLGDLTRAAFASEASGEDFGTIAATVTVQELTYTLMLILCALPVLLTIHLGEVVFVVTLLGMAGIVVILAVSRVFCTVHKVVARIPLLNRLLPAIDELQSETADLLHRPDALGLSVTGSRTSRCFGCCLLGRRSGLVAWDARLAKGGLCPGSRVHRRRGQLDPRWGRRQRSERRRSPDRVRSRQWRRGSGGAHPEVPDDRYGARVRPDRLHDCSPALRSGRSVSGRCAPAVHQLTPVPG